MPFGETKILEVSLLRERSRSKSKIKKSNVDNCISNREILYYICNININHLSTIYNLILFVYKLRRLIEKCTIFVQLKKNAERNKIK